MVAAELYSENQRLKKEVAELRAQLDKQPKPPAIKRGQSKTDDTTLAGEPAKSVDPLPRFT